MPLQTVDRRCSDRCFNTQVIRPDRLPYRPARRTIASLAGELAGLMSLSAAELSVPGFFQIALLWLARRIGSGPPKLYDGSLFAGSR